MRFSSWAIAITIAIGGGALASGVEAKTVVDIYQRKVEVPDNPQRIILGESRMLYSLALIENGDPSAHVVGWPGDMLHYDPQSWQLYVKAFPHIATIPQLGTVSYDQMSVENILALKPDLVILPRYAKRPSSEGTVEAQLTKAEVPFIYVDFRVDPLHNTVPSLRLLGEVLNTQQKAGRFIEFYQQHMQYISRTLATYKGPKPKVMLQLHLGRKESCCTTVGKGNLADLLEFAGGQNIAKNMFKGVYGEMNPESVIIANPDIYMTTGMSGAEKPDDLQLGPLVSREQAEESFRNLMSKQPILSSLRAVKDGKAYSLWHNFYLSPYHLLDVEMFAKAFYPQLFASLDPQQTLQQMYQQFLPIPLTGTYWTQLPAAK
ncbi:ABC transporter substrate-binding protein [Serratia sp. M24T3]|uniref:ABC transporter substrate-binding protein n=1 Tax=Serratia sp. M24T3 TaxID=932213 RepID=UPI00025B9F3F|nr:ABC transporter substrate-binding protein [Serratia sp. M24T3]EIC85215.1 ABC transporter substrate-binding protein [Serratia sp. M24T3]